MHKKIIRPMVAVAAACLPVSSFASEIYFGGFSFVGEAQAIKTSYPLTDSFISGGSGQSVLNMALLDRVRKIQNPGFSLVVEQLGTLGPDSKSALAMSFALDRESVSVEKIAGLYKVVVDLSAEALFFDFKEKALVGSYPVSVEYIDTLQHEPSRQDLLALVERLYTGTSGVNIFDEFAKTVSGITLNPAPACRFQVTQVTINDQARAALPDYVLANEGAYRAAIAQDFSKYLSVNQRIGILPYQTGHAIGNSMATRFADGTVFNLKIPEADYTIGLDLSNLKRIDYGSSAAGASYVYGVAMTVTALEPVSGTTYLKSRIKNGVTKVVPTGQTSIDEWPAYSESLLSLMSKFTKALSAPTSEWGAALSDTKSTPADMEKLEKVISKCR